MYRIFCFVVIFILLGVACQKEGNLTPGEDVVNYFEVSDEATDEESVLRRDFQKETGSYLLFNDTLRKEFVGRDEDGFPIYSFEQIDLGYGILSSSMDKFAFRYLEEMETKRASVNFIKERLLVLMDKSLVPYSFLLVDEILKYKFLQEGGNVNEGFYGKGVPINYYYGTRCFAISMGDILEADDEEREIFLKTMIVEMINNMLAARQSVMADFYALSEAYYGVSGYAYYDFDLYIYDLRELGFITGRFEYDEYDDDYYMRCPSKEEDVASFLEVIFGDEEIFLEENADYQLVIEKYNLLKIVITNLGFHLELFNRE